MYPIVSSNDDRCATPTRVDGLRPGAVAIAQGIGYSLDVTIDDYVLIDMQGFLDVIDALGGVTVNVPKAVPTPGNPPGARHPVPDVIRPGVAAHGRHDGARLRAQPQSRHRLPPRRPPAAGARGARPPGVAVDDALTGYSTVDVGRSATRLRTSLTTDEFTNLLGLLGGETAIVESVGLVPPLVNVPTTPNYDAMAKIVGEVQMALVTGQPSGY